MEYNFYSLAIAMLKILTWLQLPRIVNFYCGIVQKLPRIWNVLQNILNAVEKEL